MKKQVLSLVGIIGSFGILFMLPSYSSGPSAAGSGRTGAPSESSCVQCHSSNSVNSGAGSFAISFENGITSYVAGQTYNVTVTGTGSSINKYGFQLTALKESDDAAGGSFTAGTGTKLATMSSRNYIEQSSGSSSGVWTFTWTAPAQDEGAIKFYLAGNAAESPGGTGGDNIYTSTATLTSGSNSIIEQESINVKLYPNPVTNSFAIEYLGSDKITQVKVVGLEGKLVKTFEDNSMGVFSIEELNSGLYNLQFNVGNKVYTKKLLKK